MASAHLSPYTSSVFPIPTIPKDSSNPAFPLTIPLYSTNNISRTMGVRKESGFVEVRNNILENGAGSDTSRSLPRVVFSAHFSPQRALSPSEFSLSPASYSSAEEEMIVHEQEQNAITTLASLAIVARNMQHQSPAFSVASSTVSSPPSSPSASPRRSSRKPKPSRRSKEQMLSKRRLSGPATRLRRHKPIISGDEEKEEYYRERTAIVPEKLDAPHTRTRRLPVVNAYGVVGCGGYNPALPKNPNYPLPPPKSFITSKWTPSQHKAFLALYLMHGKDFPLIGRLIHKTTSEVVEYYYLCKHSYQFRLAKNMKKDLEEYEDNLNKIEAQVKGLAKIAQGKKGGRKKKVIRS
ncbi:511_t:CDS:1 [Acaulospora morrowiae]|uniref:511_t:CDS:1 n=1 Tax=Acaulospora morrowiae TaxID=94023 RepID=A0A9N9GJ07_9GLOM|nr:511_t:CDS:1 [Acaulospora morrowiae]